MKLTRTQLRRLIAEAFKQKVPLFDPVTRREIETLRQKGRQNADLSGLSQSARSSLETLEASDEYEQNMARELYQTFGSTEPDITVQQEEDFFAGQDAMLQDMSSFNVAQAYYKEVADYLTPTQIKILAKAENVPLHAVIDHSQHGILFHHEDTRETFIDASVFDLMTRQIFLRNSNPSQSELNSIMNDTSDRINEVTHDLFKRIVKASRQTSIYVSDLEEIGIGELDEYGDWNTPFGELEIYNSYNDDIIDLIPTKLMLVL
jgi:hypothetical protein